MKKKIILLCLIITVILISFLYPERISETSVGDNIEYTEALNIEVPKVEVQNNQSIPSTDVNVDISENGSIHKNMPMLENTDFEIIDLN